MQLPFLKQSEPEKSFFLSLLIKPYKVAAILFEEVNNKLFILANYETEVESDIDQISQEELLMASDRAISSVEPKLPEGVNVEKTIFSLPFDWIIDSKIKDVYLEKLKGVCKALGLTPIGYLTAIEAIVHFIDKKEGAPVSAIFFEITKNRVFAYLVRAGKILEAHSETVSENLISTSEEILKKFNSVDVLPAKIILLDLENSASIQQDFLSHKWPGSIPFLHVPQVTVLEKGFENEAVVNGVAQQMELEVLSDVKRAEEALPIDEGEAEGATKDLEEANGADFGFIKEEDVAKKDDGLQTTDDSSMVTDEKEESLEGEKDEGQNLENLEDAEAAAAIGASKKNAKEDVDVNYFKEHEEEVKNEAFPSESKLKIPKLPAFDVILSSIKKVKLPAVPIVGGLGGGSKNKLIIGSIGLVLFIILFSFVYYNFILHANIVVLEDQKSFDKSTNITFTKDGSNNSIKMDVATEEVKGNEDKNATGQKITGDKARGSVTIYNKTEDAKTFSNGTTIVGPNNLEFVTTDDVKIASTSSFSTNLSSASVKVEAAQFGKEYNLPSNSNFTIKGFSTSDFIAKNSDATSGGTSKTTTVVSAKDLSDLLNLVTQKLQGDAIAKAQTGSTGQVILQTPLSQSVKDKSYSKKQGDQASSVSLAATVSYDIGKYSQSDLDNFVANLSKSEVPGTYVLEKGNSKFDVTDLKISKDGNSASATLKINAVYSPQVDSETLAKDIKGKSQKAAEEKVKSLSGISDVNITFQRKLPLFPTFLPFNSKNITITVNH